MATDVPSFSPPSPGKARFTWAALRAKIEKDPAVFGFFGLTVAALGRGLLAMLANDRRGSQRMMRFRVGFQLACVGALVGGMYFRGLQAAMGDAAPAAAAAPAPAAEAAAAEEGGSALR